MVRSTRLHALSLGLLAIAVGLTTALLTAGAEPAARGATPLWRTESTLHEGHVLYGKHWNFWTRAGASVDPRGEKFFLEFQTGSPAMRALLDDIGFAHRKAETEEEVWNRIGMLWRWCRDHVRTDNEAYGALAANPDNWPSFEEHARYYRRHRHLVWAACFSKAHLFAGLLGRLFYPADRIAMAHTHHAENGAPPTATHVYVAVYVADRWFYLDPTAIPSTDFPPFEKRRSVGVAAMRSVDYEHPYKVTPLPGSTLSRVPLLPRR